MGTYDDIVTKVAGGFTPPRVEEKSCGIPHPFRPVPGSRDIA